MSPANRLEEDEAFSKPSPLKLRELDTGMSLLSILAAEVAPSCKVDTEGNVEGSKDKAEEVEAFANRAAA